jgi:hypothetical protein
MLKRKSTAVLLSLCVFAIPAIGEASSMQELQKQGEHVAVGAALTNSKNRN